VLGRGEVAYPHLDEIIGVGAARIAWAELAIPGGAMLELFCYRQPPGHAVEALPNDPGSTHIAFEVDGLDEMVDRLRAHGARLRSPAPVTIAAGDWRGWRDIYVHDPDGALVELSERPASPG
jgi:catechol 2,3-dioxygenase-like lactoylglutathione lyase family enzyme